MSSSHASDPPLRQRRSDVLKRRRWMVTLLAILCCAALYALSDSKRSHARDLSPSATLASVSPITNTALLNPGPVAFVLLLWTLEKATEAGILIKLLPPAVKVAIYIEPDALFVSDPAALWRLALSLMPDVAPAVSLFYDQKTLHVNSRVLLLNLQKLRDVRLMDSSVYRKVDHATNGAISPSAFRAVLGPPTRQDGRYDVRAMGGDAVFWRAFVTQRPDLFRTLDAGYISEGCSRAQGAGLDAGNDSDDGAVAPRLVHVDCVKTKPYTSWRGWEDADTLANRRWGDAVRYFTNYKWLWLNAADTEPAGAFKMTVIQGGVVYGDERYAATRRPQ
ncbi:hypothetical protein BD626DRAFT_520642 [Schizophyllum amplum]|uniref:Uncharacterized protein n=1 Tax=Schizophyllum amplum TaxID=97359 RepID=A0A550BUA8_9AGAR|nr:hypothetical protein BD626DRAFT_520642 [Auriculariopsis ampla]